MRPLPDTKDRSNRSTDPPSTTEAPGKLPGARMLPGPRPLPPIPAPHKQHDYTNDTAHIATRSTALQSQAPPFHYLAIQKAKRSSKMLLWHRKNSVCAAQPAKTTSNSEPAGTTVAKGGPDSDNGHGGASEHRNGGNSDCETRRQARGGGRGGGRMVLY